MRCIFLTRADMPFRAQSSPACLPPTRDKITKETSRSPTCPSTVASSRLLVQHPPLPFVFVVPLRSSPDSPTTSACANSTAPSRLFIGSQASCWFAARPGHRACARVTVTWAPPSPIPSPSPPRLPLSRDRQAEDGPFYIPLVLESLTPLSIYCGSSPGHCPRTLRHSYSQLLLSSLRSLVSSSRSIC